MNDSQAIIADLQQQLAQAQAENQQLRQNQERLHYALEGSRDGTWDWLIPDNQAVLSDRYREMLGYRPDELPDSVDSWLNSIHPDDMPQVTRTLDDYLAGRRNEYMVEHRLQHKSGEWRWMLSRGRVVARDEAGQPLRMTGTVSDITERKQRELSEQQLSTLVETFSDFVGFAMLDGKAGYVNAAGRTMLGLGIDQDLSDIMIEQFHPPDDIAFLRQTILPAVQEHGEWRGEFRFRHFQTGDSIPISFVLFQVKNPHTRQIDRLGCIARNISEQKRVEEERQRLVAIAENSPDFIGMATFDGVPLYLNPAGMALIGLENMEQARRHKIIDFFPIEDRAFSEQEILPVVMRDGFWQGEVRFRHFQTEEPIPVHYTLFLVHDPASGAPLGIGTVTRDITEQKRQQAEVSIFKTMADTAPDGFGMADADGTLTYANVAYQNMTGYGPALVGMNFLDHFSETDRPAAIEALTTTARQGDWQGVLNFQRSDGSIIPIDAKGFVTRNEAGDIAAVMGLFRDLSEQRKQEAERAALQQQVIDAQRNTVRELSTPLIPLTNDVLIMPLIGTIDSQRAQQVMEALLEGVAQHQAELVILDITGVAIVDTQVAQAFMQAAQAVRLLGAQVMLTGIQPQIAQTLVHLGVDLSSIQTRGSLQAGIAAVFESQ
jgi:rsbT co-antagonist protein RsbR